MVGNEIGSQTSIGFTDPPVLVRRGRRIDSPQMPTLRLPPSSGGMVMTGTKMLSSTISERPSVSSNICSVCSTDIRSKSPSKVGIDNSWPSEFSSRQPFDQKHSSVMDQITSTNYCEELKKLDISRSSPEILRKRTVSPPPVPPIIEDTEEKRREGLKIMTEDPELALTLPELERVWAPLPDTPPVVEGVIRRCLCHPNIPGLCTCPCLDCEAIEAVYE